MKYLIYFNKIDPWLLFPKVSEECIGHTYGSKTKVRMVLNDLIY